MPSSDQLKDIEKQNKYTNTKLYHDNGIKGGGCNILVLDGEIDHREGNFNRVLEVAPEANVFLASMESAPNQEPVVIFENNRMSLPELIELKNIKIITKSLGGSATEDTAESKWWNDLKAKYNLILNHSAGNEKIGGSIPHDSAIYWTQANMGKNDKIVKLTTIADGDQVDFGMFSGFLNGSSFSSPAGAGHEDLIIQRYGNYGLNMSHDEMFAYLKMISQDLFAEGKDEKIGYGIPILPSFDKKFISMSTNSYFYYEDGHKCMMDTKPVNKCTDEKSNDWTVFVPLRVICNCIGANLVEPVHNTDRTIHIEFSKGNTEVVLNTSSKIAKVNGDDVELTQAPFIDDHNRTLVPLRFVSEVLGCKVEWNQSKSQVLILG